MKHVERTKSGSVQYRRRVLKDVSAIISKREFKRKPGNSRNEALAVYPRYHTQEAREIAEARRRKRPYAGGASERQAYAEALRRRADLIAAGAREEARMVRDHRLERVKVTGSGGGGKVLPLHSARIRKLHDPAGGYGQLWARKRL